LTTIRRSPSRQRKIPFLLEQAAQSETLARNVV